MRNASAITLLLDGKLVKLSLTPRQTNAAIAAAARVRMNVSEWVRTVAKHAAGEHTIDVAAAMTSMPLSAWLREVVCAASTSSPLRSQLVRAWKKQREMKGPRKAPRARTRGSEVAAARLASLELAPE